MSNARRRAIAVCGSGTAEAEVLAMAKAVGSEIVSRGVSLVCGGMGGVMEAAALGGREAREAGGEGLVVGILPGELLDGGNAHCEVVIPTGMGVARNVLVVRSADAVILVSGGAGTLSEAAYAWQFGKPLVALAPSGGWAAEIAGTRLDQRRGDEVKRASGAVEAVDLALEGCEP